MEPTYSISNGQIISTTQNTVALSDLKQQSTDLGALITQTQAQKDAIDAVIAEAEAASITS